MEFDHSFFWGCWCWDEFIHFFSKFCQMNTNYITFVFNGPCVMKIHLSVMRIIIYVKLDSAENFTWKHFTGVSTFDVLCVYVIYIIIIMIMSFDKKWIIVHMFMDPICDGSNCGVRIASLIFLFPLNVFPDYNKQV